MHGDDDDDGEAADMAMDAEAGDDGPDHAGRLKGADEPKVARSSTENDGPHHAAVLKRRIAELLTEPGDHDF